jgi:hypothetical protein
VCACVCAVPRGRLCGGAGCGWVSVAGSIAQTDADGNTVYDDSGNIVNLDPCEDYTALGARRSSW